MTLDSANGCHVSAGSDADLTPDFAAFPSLAVILFIRIP